MTDELALLRPWLVPGSIVTSAARAALLATRHTFWDWKDGRSSEAMIALLADVHSLRATGHDASVVCFDGTFESGEARDAGMARSQLDAVDGRPPASRV